MAQDRTASTRRRPARALPVLLAATLACSGVAEGDASSTEEITSSGPSTGAPASTPGTAGGVQVFCPDEDDRGLIADDGRFSCDIYRQSGCCPGSKCTVTTTLEDDPWWNHSTCVPLVDEAGKPGDLCTIIGDPFSGLDTCEAGSMCWGLFGLPRCVSFCDESAGARTCPDPATYCKSMRVMSLCIPSCDPLTQPCPPGEACRSDGYGESDSYTCAWAGTAAYGEPCETLSSCAPGLECVHQDQVPGCTGYSCCTRYCDAAGPNTCPGAPAQRCLPVYPGPQEPLPYPNVGLCLVAADDSW